MHSKGVVSGLNNYGLMSSSILMKAAGDTNCIKTFARKQLSFYVNGEPEDKLSWTNIR